VAIGCRVGEELLSLGAAAEEVFIVESGTGRREGAWLDCCQSVMEGQIDGVYN
jgi:hypothetical protein